MLGTEPRPRNRTNPDKNRVTKAKNKEEKPKKKAVKVEKEKEEGKVSRSKAAPAMPSPPLKDEKDFIPPEPSSIDNLYSTPTSMATPMSDIQSRMRMRLLTPCSDSDALTTSPHIYTPAAVPACPTDMLLGHTGAPFHFTGSSTTTTTTGSWQPTLPTYAGYGMGYELDAYATAFAVSASQQNEQHAAEQLRVHAAMMEHENHTGMIKQEDWDAQQYQC